MNIMMYVLFHSSMVYSHQRSTRYYIIYVFQGAGLTGRRGNLIADSVQYVLNVALTGMYMYLAMRRCACSRICVSSSCDHLYRQMGTSSNACSRDPVYGILAHAGRRTSRTFRRLGTSWKRSYVYSSVALERLSHSSTHVRRNLGDYRARCGDQGNYRLFVSVCL